MFCKSDTKIQIFWALTLPPQPTNDPVVHTDTPLTGTADNSQMSLVALIPEMAIIIGKGRSKKALSNIQVFVQQITVYQNL